MFKANTGSKLALDETALSKGELYTILTNKKAKGKKGSLLSIIKGTQSDQVIKYVKQIPYELRRKVKEITLDMAGSMKKIATVCFPNAIQVTDRFHVQKLAIEAVQNVRIKYRWEAIDIENEDLKKAKETHKAYQAILFENGDTARQLLARSRYLLYKSVHKWTEDQRLRARILFKHYPKIHKAYTLSEELKSIYNSKSKGIAMTKLAHWYNKIEQSGMKAFNTIKNTITLNYQTILNYFDNRSTNASAESFNAKIKAFRAQFRGVRNTEYFLYRLTQIFG